MRVVLAELAFQADLTLGDGSLEGIWPDALERVGPRGALRQALTRWCLAAPKPLVLLIDEIDALIGDTRLSVLRQLRAGYTDRPDRLPHCVILCGVVDMRDYPHPLERRERAGARRQRPFNIKSESLRLGDFTETEVRSLLAQHTGETGQVFTEAALQTVWTLLECAAPAGIPDQGGGFRGDLSTSIPSCGNRSSSVKTAARLVRAAAQMSASANDTRCEGRHRRNASITTTFGIRRVSMFSLRSSATRWSTTASRGIP